MQVSKFRFLVVIAVHSKWTIYGINVEYVMLKKWQKNSI